LIFHIKVIEVRQTLHTAPATSGGALSIRKQKGSGLKYQISNKAKSVGDLSSIAF
jgi:hypothetical protein